MKRDPAELGVAADGRLWELGRIDLGVGKDGANKKLQRTLGASTPSAVDADPGPNAAELDR
jgi:hypothetical protein